MTLQEMYPAIVNSPFTELTQAIDNVQTTITVADGSKLPDAPNIATLGMGEDAETILYQEKVGNTLSQVTRAFQGNAKSWNQGVTVARMFTAYDFDSLRENVESVSDVANGAIQSDEKGAVGGVAKQNDLTELRDDFDEHLEERASKTEFGHVKAGSDIDVEEGVISVDKESVRTDSETPLRTEVVSSLPTVGNKGRIVFLDDVEGGFKGDTGGEWV